MLKDVLKNFSRPKIWLILANILLVFFLIILKNTNVIPLEMGDLAFFAVLTLAFALWRPGWAFLFFIGTISLENINLAPEILGIIIRPYQFIGFLIILAIIIRFFSGRLYFKISRPKWRDWLVIIISLAGFLSIINSPDKITSLKLAIIFASFAFLYFLTRNYVQNLEDIKKIIPFFLSSSIVIILYGIWQNVRFIHNGNSFEFMPGRPNFTFAEPDWAGIYLIVIISIIYVWHSIFNFEFLIFKRTIKKSVQVSDLNQDNSIIFENNAVQVRRLEPTKGILYVFLILAFIALILTVSRSVWLGMLAATFIFLFIILCHSEQSEESQNLITGSFALSRMTINPKNWRWKIFFYNFIFIASAGIISLAAVYIFHLTDFRIFERAQSAGGTQKVTIACEFKVGENKVLPEKINNISELKNYGCRHINLEDVEKEKAAGNYVTEIYRKDPNINVRQEIYQKSWEQIKTHPILGIGLGSIGKILGKDSNGNYYNSSNIFLEIWLGAGIIGFLSFTILLLYILIEAIKKYFFSQDNWQKAFSLFIIISWFGLIIANCFNAGIFLGFLWAWLAITNYEINTKYEITKN